MLYETNPQGPYNDSSRGGDYRQNLPTYLALEDITRATAPAGTGSSIVDRTVAVLGLNNWRAPIERGE